MFNGLLQEATVPLAPGDRILAGIRSVVGTAARHDDMTVVILRAEDAG